MNNTRSHAELEFEILNATATSPDNRPIIEPFQAEILALVEKFGDSGQSGGSAPYTAKAISQAVEKLCLQDPLCPVTGIDNEWFQPMDDESMFQNKRCSALFKNGNGRAYYLDAVIWQTPNGITYSGSAKLPPNERILSRQYVKFPFEPKSFYIDVDEIEVTPDDWEFTIKNPADLDAVWEYYDKYEAEAAP